jgi:hypothetical protein
VGAVLSRLARGPRAQRGEQAPTVTTSTVMRRRLPVDVVARGETGMALVVDERNRMGWVRLTPFFATEPWRSVTLGPGREPEPVPPAPTPGMGRDVGPGGL